MKRRSKYFLGGAALIVAGIAGIRAFQAEIGQALFDRAVEARAGRDIVATLPDGLHVGLCGTGSPLPSRDRAGACTVVIAGKRILVFDAGEGGARNIALMGIPPQRIERLFLTHFHSDHLDGLGPMMLVRWTGSDNRTPLPIHGPTGVQEIVQGFNLAYRTDNGYRTAHHGAPIANPAAAGGTAVPFEVAGLAPGAQRVVFDDAGLRVTAFKVDHRPVDPAIGYRIDYAGRSVVISGDTAKSTSLAANAKGADLLVHEALQPRMVKRMTAALEARGAKAIAQITRDILSYHASPEEAADTAKQAGVRFLVLSHIVPPIPGRFFDAAYLGDAGKRFDGPIRVGRDGMLFSLPSRATTIEEKNLF